MFRVRLQQYNTLSAVFHTLCIRCPRQGEGRGSHRNVVMFGVEILE